MTQVRIFSFLLAVYIFLSAHCVQGRQILIVDYSDSTSNTYLSEQTRQFWYALGIILEQQKAKLLPYAVNDYYDISVSERLYKFESLIDEHSAEAVFWLDISDSTMTGIGIIVNSAYGKIGKFITFETYMSEVSNIALIAKEFMEHSQSFQNTEESEKDGWIVLSKPMISELTPKESAERNTSVFLAPLMDNESPFETKLSPGLESKKIGGIALKININQGIVSYVAPWTWIGGELSGMISPITRLFLTIGFQTYGGPRFSQSENEYIAGYRLSPVVGVGVPFNFRIVEIGIGLNFAVAYSKLAIKYLDYKGVNVSWWSFSPSFELSIIIPFKQRFSFYLSASFAAETGGKRLFKKEEEDEEIFKTPKATINATSGLFFSFFKYYLSE